MRALRLYRRLCEKMSSYGSCIIAYSGGVDSTLIVKAAKDSGLRYLAVFCDSPLVPKRLRKQAETVAKKLKMKFLTIESDELKDNNFCLNPPYRCYLCKNELFKLLEEIRRERGVDVVVVGTNRDDSSDYRAGMKAEEEFGVKRPHLECGLGKKEIRTIARYLMLPNADAPSEACLASRIPFGEEITYGKLKMVDEAENFLNRLGFVGCRVRYHGDVARIELRKSEHLRRITGSLRKKVHERLERIGFKFVTVDLLGYRSGSLNPTKRGKKR